MLQATSNPPKFAFIVMGSNGCGKGTLAKWLALAVGYFLVAVGDCVKQIRDGELSSKLSLEEVLPTKDGHLLTDAQVGVIREEAFARNPNEPGYVIDGDCRTVEQVNDLLVKLRELRMDEVVVLFIEVPLEVARHRMLGRGRDDDTEEACTLRHKNYGAHTVPAIEHLKSLSKQQIVKFRTIDGTPSPKEIQRLLEERLPHLMATPMMQANG